MGSFWWAGGPYKSHRRGGRGTGSHRSSGATWWLHLLVTSFGWGFPQWPAEHWWVHTPPLPKSGVLLPLEGTWKAWFIHGNEKSMQADAFETGQWLPAVIWTVHFPLSHFSTGKHLVLESTFSRRTKSLGKQTSSFLFISFIQYYFHVLSCRTTYSKLPIQLQISLMILVLQQNTY